MMMANSLGLQHNTKVIVPFGSNNGVIFDRRSFEGLEQAFTDACQSDVGSSLDSTPFNSFLLYDVSDNKFNDDS